MNHLTAVDPRDPWQERAACNGLDTRIFYPERGEPTTQAREICSRCPVAQACLRDSIERGDRWGIAGGLSYPERRKLRLGGERAA